MCDQCQAVMINGVHCHELGCPVAWRDYRNECDWCGGEFRPEFQSQRFCCDSCAEQDYYGEA